MKKLYRLIVTMIVLLLALPLMADDIAPLPTITLPSPKLQAIQLKSLKIEATITGNIAQTIYEMEFYNPNSRVLEEI